MSNLNCSRALAALALLALAWPAAAAAATPVETGWRIRVSVATIDFDSNLVGGPGYGIDVGGAVGINGEYRFNRRLGLDLGAFAGGGVDVAGHGSWIGWHEYDVYDTMSVTGLTAGLDIHLTPERRVDLYVCPMLAMMQFGGLWFEAADHRFEAAIDFDENLAIGAGVGLGVPFGELSRWSFNVSLTHLESTLDGGGRVAPRIDEDYDATLFGLGFGYRF